MIATGEQHGVREFVREMVRDDLQHAMRVDVLSRVGFVARESGG